MSTKGMKMLVAKGALEVLKSIDMGLCKSCVMDKQKRVSFTRLLESQRKCGWKWSIQMFGDHLQYHHFEDPGSTLPSLMISVGRYGFTS